VIEMPGEDVVAPVTMTSPVQIVPGGANLGTDYFTTLDTLVGAREQGYFAPTTWETGVGPNVFDPQAALDALVIMSEPIAVSQTASNIVEPINGFTAGSQTIWTLPESTDLDLGF